MADIEATRKRLGETLRDRMQKYWDLMKDWHRRKVRLGLLFPVASRYLFCFADIKG